MTSTINDHQEELQAFDLEFRCEHLRIAPHTCSHGCYVPAVGGPWKCNNPSCGGHPWKYTDPCFGTKPWIYPTHELGRWDLMRDLATDALPPGGKWALEIILDGHDVQSMPTEQLRDLSERYPDAALSAPQSAVTDFGQCADKIRNFINQNTLQFPDFPSDDEDSDDDTLADETENNEHEGRSSPKEA